MPDIRKYHSFLMGFFLLACCPGRAQVPDDGVKKHQAVADTVQKKLPPDYLIDPDYRNLVRNGLELQDRIDSLSETMARIRKLADSTTTGPDKQKLLQDLAWMEDSISLMDRAADSIFSQVSEAESYSGGSRRPFLILDTIISGIRVYHYDLDRLPLARAQKEGFSASGNTGTGVPGKPSPSVKTGASGNFEKRADVPDSFMILKESPYSMEHYFDSLFVIPQGVFYWIQLAALSNPAPPDRFTGLCPVTMIRDGDLTRYYAGRFGRLDEARKALNGVRKLGFNDAYIIGYYNGRRISLTRAAQYEALEK